MDVEAEIEFVKSTFSRVLAHEKHRMAIGMAIRNHMHEQLKLGVEIDHYRMEWLHSSISRVIDLLEQIGSEFNKEHPEDKCSSADLLDIASSVTNTIQNYIGRDD